MEKRTEFARDTIEVCRNCKANGTVRVADAIVGGLKFGTHTEVCPVCGGSGLVRKHIEGFVVVEPHNKPIAKP